MQWKAHPREAGQRWGGETLEGMRRACKCLHVSYVKPVDIVEGQGVKGGQAALWEQPIDSLSNSRVSSRSPHEGLGGGCPSQKGVEFWNMGRTFRPRAQPWPVVLQAWEMAHVLGPLPTATCFGKSNSCQGCGAGRPQGWGTGHSHGSWTEQGLLTSSEPVRKMRRSNGMAATMSMRNQPLK